MARHTTFLMIERTPSFGIGMTGFFEFEPFPKRTKVGDDGVDFRPGKSMGHVRHCRSLATGFRILKKFHHPVTTHAAGNIFEGRAFSRNNHFGFPVAIGTAKF